MRRSDGRVGRSLPCGAPPSEPFPFGPAAPAPERPSPPRFPLPALLLLSQPPPPPPPPPPSHAAAHLALLEKTKQRAQTKPAVRAPDTHRQCPSRHAPAPPSSLFFVSPAGSRPHTHPPSLRPLSPQSGASIPRPSREKTTLAIVPSSTDRRTPKHMRRLPIVVRSKRRVTRRLNQPISSAAIGRPGASRRLFSTTATGRPQAPARPPARSLAGYTQGSRVYNCEGEKEERGKVPPKWCCVFK